MSQSPDRVEVSFGAKMDELQQAMTQMGSRFSEFAKNTEAKLKPVSAATENLTNKVKQLAAAYLTLGQIKAAVDETARMAIEAEKLSKQLNITQAEAGQLSIALGDIYSSSEEFGAASAFLTRQLRTNEDRLKQLGLVTRDANGELKNGRDMMMDAVRVANTYKVGTDRNAAAQELFGRSAMEMQNVLKLNNEVLEEAKKKADALGLTLTKQGEEDVAKYRAAMNDAMDVVSGLRKVMGEALIPVLTTLGNWFAGDGPDAVKGFREAVRLIVSAVWILVAGIQVLVQVGVAAFKTLSVQVAQYAEMAQKAIKFDWAGVFAASRRGTEQVADIWRNAGERILDRSREVNDQLRKLWGEADSTPAGNAPGPRGSRSYVPEAKGKDSAKETSRMSEWEAALMAQRDAFERMKLEAGSFQQFSKAQESAFWKDILSRQDLTKEERLAITKKYYEAERDVRKAAFDAEIASLREQGDRARTGTELRVQLAEEAARRIGNAYGLESKEYKAAQGEVLRAGEERRQQQIQLQDMLIERERAESEHTVQIKREEIETLRALGQITDKEKLIALKALHELSYAIELQALQEKILLYAEDEVQYQQYLDRIAELKRKHDERIKQSDREINVARKAELDRWLTPFGDAFQTMVDGVLRGTQRMADVTRNILSNMTSQFIAMVAKMGLEWLKTELFKTQATVVGTATREAAETSAASTSIAATAGNAIKTIGAKAWEAAASVYASVAQIPVVGPFLAPALAVGAAGAVLAFIGNIAKFEQGAWEIPRAGMAMLHPGETVLPRYAAEAFRSMAEGGSPGAREGDASEGAVILHQKINFVLPGNPDRRTQNQMASLVGMGAQRAIRRVR